MKQGTLVTRVVILTLFAAVLAYLGFTVWQGLSEPYQLVTTYTYQMDDGLALDGMVVRRETVIEGRSDLSEILPQEGEKVASGAAVALVYQNATAMQDRREAKELRLQLEQLNYAMRRNDSLGDANKLDSQLVTTLAELKTSASNGELSGLEEQGLDLRSLVLKRTGDLTTNAQSLSALQQAAAGIEARLKALNNSSGQLTRYVTVDQSGIFSGLADGYEERLYPDMLDGLTVGQLDQLLQSGTEASQTAIGKLITGSTWYFATSVDDASAKRLEEGKKYTLAFTGDFGKEVSMKLERLGSSEGGRRMAVFSSDRYLSQVTLTRMCTATLIFERFSGVRVPNKALRVRTNDDGTTTLGVYTLVGRQAEFKSVEIVREGEDFYLLRGTATNRKVLRPGDTVILSNQELYNGKVIL